MRSWPSNSQVILLFSLRERPFERVYVFCSLKSLYHEVIFNLKLFFALILFIEKIVRYTSSLIRISRRDVWWNSRLFLKNVLAQFNGESKILHHPRTNYKFGFNDVNEVQSASLIHSLSKSNMDPAFKVFQINFFSLFCRFLSKREAMCC